MVVGMKEEKFMLGLGWRSLYHESWPLRKRLTGTVSV